jgi:hypothetical protein
MTLTTKIYSSRQYLASRRRDKEGAQVANTFILYTCVKVNGGFWHCLFKPVLSWIGSVIFTNHDSWFKRFEQLKSFGGFIVIDELQITIDESWLSQYWRLFISISLSSRWSVLLTVASTTRKKKLFLKRIRWLNGMLRSLKDCESKNLSEEDKK